MDKLANELEGFGSFLEDTFTTAISELDAETNEYVDADMKAFRDTINTVTKP